MNRQLRGPRNCVERYTQAVANAKNVNQAKAASDQLDVVIVGAGLAGLACARDLIAAGFKVVVLEGADAPGGRVRTDLVDGFRLDRGFQVLLSAYPEAKRVLNYEKLELRSFLPGALVRHGGRFHRFADPFREFGKALSFAFDPIVPMGDKLRVARLRAECVGLSESELSAIPEQTTFAFLQSAGFTSAIIERFFRPFFGGVFLELDLATSARWFKWLFGLFAQGSAVVPELGMEAIPSQLAKALPEGVIQCGAAVTKIERKGKRLYVEAGGAGGFDVGNVVMATEEPESRRLLANLDGTQVAPGGWNRTTTYYYAASRPPVDEAVIVLSGEGPTAGPVNHLAVMNLVAPSYAPAGGYLICANVVGEAPLTEDAIVALEIDVRVQLGRWFGGQVSDWSVLAGYPIANALPARLSYEPGLRAPSKAGVVLCGDYLQSSSIQGALVSGAQAAEAVRAKLKK